MKRVSVIVLLWSMCLMGQSDLVSLQGQIYGARDKVLPALVHVEPIKKIYNRGEEQRTLVTGSGVIFSPEGYVMTNDHVAGNAEKVWCTLSNKERITATVVGSDPSTDIAVLKLNLDELKDPSIISAALGNSDDLQVGQIVLALGSPLGLSRSVSMGVVSSIDRYFPDRGSMISPYNLWIQTDAAINPGNSGGPLIDLTGKVIGINARAVFLADNLGFAIPINLARSVSEEIIKGSTVQRAWIGMELKPIKDFREYVDKPDLKGALVVHIEKNSPVEKAGLKAGDVVQRIGEDEINASFEEDLPAVRQVIATLPIDESVEFAIWRDGKSRKLKVKTIKEPFNDEPEYDAAEWGIVIKNLSWHIYRMQMLQDFDGIYVTSVKPGGPGEQANIRNGDVIKKINGTKVKDKKDLMRLYEASLQKKTEPIFVEIIRQGHPYFAVIKQKTLKAKNAVK